MAQFDIYDRIGREFKMSAGNVIGLRNTIETAVGFAGVFTAGVGLIDSASTLLKAFGLIEDEMAQMKLQLADIDKNVKIIVKRLGEESEEGKIHLRTQWKKSVVNCGEAINALRTSRSPEHFRQAVDAVKQLANALSDMLAWGEDLGFGPRTTTAGHVPFVMESHKVQGWRPSWALPEHWFQYASVMRTVSGSPAPTTELQRIWDPGHFVDLVATGLRDLLAGFAVVEPAYRSTGTQLHARLRKLTESLSVFIATWERMLLITPVELQIRDDGYVCHPYYVWYNEELRGRIALGVADLATGATTLDVRYPVPDTEGKSIETIPGFPGGPRQYVADVDAARAAAKFDLQRMVNEMKSRVGINNLRNLHTELSELCESPSRSQFCRLRDFESVSLWGWQWPTPEEISIHSPLVASTAGAVGKKYKATRWSQLFHKQFRVPMVRRMDMSLAQLGYQISLRIPRASSQPAELHLDLCNFDTWDLPNIPPTVPDMFPVKHFDQIFSVPDAKLFEVVQTDSHTSADATDLDAQKPSLEVGRIFVDKGSGPVSVHVKVDTRIDYDTPDHAYVGFADVLIELHEPGDHKDSFIVEVAVYETGLLSSNDQQIKQYADGVNLHMIPTFLIAEDAYFIDMMKGYAQIENTLKDVPPLVKFDWPLPTPDDDPFSPVYAAKRLDALVKAVENLQQTHPEILTPIMLRRMPLPRVRTPVWSPAEARDYALRALHPKATKRGSDGAGSGGDATAP
ncbi:hypothetical protein [Nocardia asiatica]|uniref:hypothetical protein n=1 Tax=Nocardia asiatica TaxID=209252 RepID=UPI00245854AC|nr:hypothetical protein [Nocardia asiatica]